MQSFREKYGPWAVVTGGTTGIGLEFGRLLAAHGIHVVLVARNREALDACASMLQASHGISTRCVCADLATEQGLSHLEESTADLEVGLLVNNAGGSLAGAVLTQSIESLEKLLRLNVWATLRLGRHYSSKMQTRKHGGVVFLASNAAFQAIPYLAVYAASKAFVLSLAESMHQELKPYGVDVLALAPGPTKTPGLQGTQGINIHQTVMSLANPADVAKAGLAALGRRSVIVHGFINKLLIFLSTRLFPRALWVQLTAGGMRKAVDKDRQ